MLFTNTKSHGGNFDIAFKSELASSASLRIASGYFSLDTLKQYESDILSKSSSKSCKVLLGMAFYEGLSQKQFDAVKSLNAKMVLRGTDSGFYVTNGRKYHGKIFQVNGKTFLGSSNFSCSGFRNNIEATVQCVGEQVDAIDSFLDDLFSEEFSIPVHYADIPIRGKTKLISDKPKLIWEGLKKHILTPTSPNIHMDKCIATYDLLSLSEKEKSNLNVYFGKGRLNRNTGIISPRPWYEIEIISNKSITSNPNYPSGSFMAYTDDGYIIPMKTSGDYKKNLRSEGGLQVFGRWLKGRLEDAGDLDKFTEITPATFLEYGKTKLSLYKMENENSYYMTFED